MSSQEHILQDMHSSGQFNQSFVMNPITLNSQQSFFKKNQFNSRLKKNQRTQSSLSGALNITKNQDSKESYGDYQEYKLKKYLFPDDDYEFQSQSQRYKNRANRLQNSQDSIIQILTIDPESLVVSMNNSSTDAFMETIKRYSVYDITFVSVVGERNAGKSMFCDKLLNLADVKGNNFCKHNSSKTPGLFMWNRPFIRDNVCIFFVEVSSCGLSQTTFRILNSISLMISSQYVLINSYEDKEEKSLKQFSLSLQKSLKAFELPENFQTKNYLPHVLHNLYRHQLPNNLPASSIYTASNSFTDIHPHILPSVKSAGYKGSDSDLVQLPYLIKNIINPEYIVQISAIFKSIYKLAHHKKVYLNSSHDQLIINSNIIVKILQYSISQINSKKKIKVDKMYEYILRDLYISAKNFSVMYYHEQLGDYFNDQQPKPLQNILQIFQDTKNKALNQFTKYNISKKLHQQFEAKLQAHIETKQELLLSINSQKIQQKLRNHLENSKIDRSNPQAAVQCLRSFKNQLNDGKDNITKQFLCQIYKDAGSQNYKIQKQMERLHKQLQSKNSQLAKVKTRKQRQTKATETARKQWDSLRKQQQKLTAEIKQAQANIELEKKKGESIKEGRGLEEVISQRQKLHGEKNSSQQLLKKLRNENPQQILAQLSEKKKKQILGIKEEQKVIEQKLSTLRAELKMGNKQGEKSKPKMTTDSKVQPPQQPAESTIKDSRKKSIKPKNELKK